MKTRQLFLKSTMPLVILAFMFSTLSFAQSDQSNTYTQNQSEVNLESTQELSQNEEMPYPWLGYQGITNVQLAKQAWIADNNQEYLKMLPASNTTSSKTLLKSKKVLNLVNDAEPLTYGKQVSTSLVQSNSANIGELGSTGNIGASYSFVATSSYTRISTCNSETDFDTYLKIYTENNGNLTEIASNDDACGLNSALTLPTNKGQTYYALVNGVNNTIGNVVIQLAVPVEPIANPSLGQPCPLKLVLVLDESGSIGNGANAAFVRNGVNAFVSGLLGTGTQMAIVEFSNVATTISLNGSSNLQTVNASYQTAVSNYLTTNYSPSGWTNWAAAFDEVYALNPDLVIFFTDGQPYLPPNSTQQILDLSIMAANAVKVQGTRVFMLGVGPGVNVSNLQDVSGTEQVDPPTVPFALADYGLQADFTTIEASLTALSTAFLTNYYADNDGDGFGAGTATNACDAPGTNYVTNDGDCDDTDGSVYPGAPDLCDGIANDCSDPNWPTPNALDTDDDGDGYSECAGDCDDLDANVYPNAPEICDGKDNDCSGAIEDADCDGVEDACDICPGGDDSIDGNGDGLPDCAYPPAYADIDASWKCANNKVTICHVDDEGNRFELCVNKNAINGHMGHGDYLGPCISCDGAKTSHLGKVVNELLVQAYPVPANELLMVELNSAINAHAEIQIVDNLGRLIYQSDIKLNIGSNVMEIDVSEFNSGVYMLHVISENASGAVKIVVE